jgi:hypothetical protein
MKLRDLMRGTRAIHVVDLPLVNVPNSGAEHSPELDAARKRDAELLGTTAEQLPQFAKIGLRCLRLGESSAAYEGARTYAKALGVDNPSEEDPLYNLGAKLHTLVRACVDPDSDPSNPAPFFGDAKSFDDDRAIESALEDIQSNPALTVDSVEYLCQQWEWWTDRVNPQIKNLSDREMFGLIGSLVGDPDRFLSWRPGVQRSLVHFMALQLWSFLSPKSESGGGSIEPTNPGTKEHSAQSQKASN